MRCSTTARSSPTPSRAICAAPTDVMRALQEAKISLFDVTHQLQVEGVQLFSRFFRRTARRDRLQAEAAGVGRCRAGPPLARKIAAALRRGNRDSLRRPIFSSGSGPTTRRSGRAIPTPPRSSKNRSGGSTSSNTCSRRSPASSRSPSEIKDVFEATVVCGMGGSSLAPDILADTFGPNRRYPRLRSRLDLAATDQGARSERSRSPRHSSSFRARAARRRSQTRFTPTSTTKSAKEIGASMAGRNFAAITDPGTTLDKEAQEADFRADFRKRSEHRRQILRALFRRHCAFRDRGLRHNLLLDRALGAMHANDRTVDPRKRARRTLRRRNRRSRRQRARQAHDRHPSSRKGLRRVGRATHRRVDRQARQGNRSDRRRDARTRRTIIPTIASSSTSARISRIRRPTWTRSFGRSKRPDIR